MAEGSKQTAKERASFARADRLKREEAQRGTEQKQEPTADRENYIAGLEHFGTINGHPILKVRNDLTPAERKIIDGVGQKFMDGNLGKNDIQKAKEQLKAIDQAKKGRKDRRAKSRAAERR